MEEGTPGSEELGKLSGDGAADGVGRSKYCIWV